MMVVHEFEKMSMILKKMFVDLDIDEKIITWINFECDDHFLNFDQQIHNSRTFSDKISWNFWKHFDHFCSFMGILEFDEYF